MKYAFSLVILADIVYQLWGIPESVNWSIYYDLIHFLFVFYMAAWSIIYLPNMKAMSVGVMFYFGFVSIVELSNVNSTPVHFWAERGNPNPIYTYGLFAVTVLLIILTYLIKKWKSQQSKN